MGRDGGIGIRGSLCECNESRACRGRKASRSASDKSFLAKQEYNDTQAEMAELVYAQDLKSCGPFGPCGFESLSRHSSTRNVCLVQAIRVDIMRRDEKFILECNRRKSRLTHPNGDWLSLVERPLWEREVTGSNPVSPTHYERKK